MLGLKYVKFMEDKFPNYDKTGLSSIVVSKYDSCTHDLDNPSPCVITTVYEWSGL